MVNECVKAGYIRLVAIVLTERGKTFSDKIFSPIFKAEESAIMSLAEAMSYLCHYFQLDGVEQECYYVILQILQQDMT